MEYIKPELQLLERIAVALERLADLKEKELLRG